MAIGTAIFLSVCVMVGVPILVMTLFTVALILSSPNENKKDHQ